MIQNGSGARRVIPLLAVALLGAMGAGTACHSKASGGELMLTGAADPGPSAFMPPAASPPPTNTQPPPSLQPQGNGDTVETAPLPGDRDGLYGGTVNNAEVDCDKIADFLSANPTQANSFVESLNSDITTYWSGGNHLTVADVPRYLHELTPAVLRLDTRITDHGLDGTHSIARQSVFQAGNAVLVDAHGVPRVRGLSGNPLTPPEPLRGAPKLLGTPWPGYHPGALARVEPVNTDIKNFVLVDVVTGKPFNRPVGTTGGDDTPHTQPVGSPGPASTATKAGHDPVSDIDGTYVWHITADPAYGCNHPPNDWTFAVTHQGNTMSFVGNVTLTGPLNADGSFLVTVGDLKAGGVFATEGGHSVIRDGTLRNASSCVETFTGTKQ
jgi:hypothetical protein